MYLVLEKALWVIKEKSEASAIPSWSHPACQPHLFPAFTAIVFTALPLWEPTSWTLSWTRAYAKILSPSITPVALTSSPARQ